MEQRDSPSPKDITNRMTARRRPLNADDGFVRETYRLPREEARAQARAILDRWPAAAYMTVIDNWRALPGDQIEFTMKRLRSAD